MVAKGQPAFVTFFSPPFFFLLIPYETKDDKLGIGTGTTNPKTAEFGRPSSDWHSIFQPELIELF